MMLSLPPRAASPPSLLVSVRDPDEAEMVAAAGPCLVDAKDPAHGALGALPLATIRAIQAAVATRAATSAVAGEPADWDDLAQRITAIAMAGVDMIKVAWPRAGTAPPPQLPEILGAVRCPVVAVFFAEMRPGEDQAALAARSGFSGAMIDTSRKDGRRLVDHLPVAALTAFVRTCNALGLLSGLAGSLRLADITELAPLRPSYLGFRGGLCRNGGRENALDPARIAEALSRLDAVRHHETAA
jgi:uncharacterized protein (UPF0264 family)